MLIASDDVQDDMRPVLASLDGGRCVHSVFHQDLVINRAAERSVELVETQLGVVGDGESLGAKSALPDRKGDGRFPPRALLW